MRSVTVVDSDLVFLLWPLHSQMRVMMRIITISYHPSKVTLVSVELGRG